MKKYNILIIVAFAVLLSSIPIIVFGKVEPLVAIIPAYIVAYVLIQVSYILRLNDSGTVIRI